MLARFVPGVVSLFFVAAASAQGSFASANLTGFASGSAAPLPGTSGGSLSYNQSPAAPTTDATGFSGGTSGGLGDDPTFSAGFAQLTLKGSVSPTTLARGGTSNFQAVFEAQGSARFDAADYTGSISANLQVQGEFDIAGPVGAPVPYFLAVSSSFAGNFRIYSQDNIGNQTDLPSGAGTLLPGAYFFQFSGNLGAGSDQGQPTQQSIDAIATLTVPAPGGSVALGVAAGGMLIAGFRRRGSPSPG